jgi:hypothetical protein
MPPTLITTSIGDYALSGDTGLEVATFTNLVVSVGNYVFNGCTSLTSVDLSNATRLTTLGAYVFNGCTSLSEIDLSKTAIGTGDNVNPDAFAGSSITTVTVPSTVLPTTYALWTGYSAPGSSANSITIIVASSSAPCFLKGTRILTSERGYVLVEKLTRSDKLLNHLGKKMNVLDVSTFTCNTRPYLIPKGCRIGSSYKCIEDLYLSPRHEILIENKFTAVQDLGGKFEQVDLITPLHMSNADFVGGNECKGNVTMRITNAQRCNDSYEYYHITTDNYFTDVIMSNGIPSESFGMHMCMNMDKRFVSGLMKRIRCDDGVSRKLLTTAKFMLWLDEFRRATCAMV